jgi:gliding motility-associated-like protein
VRYVNVSADEATYLWSDGYPDPDRTLDQTGVYEVVVTNKCGTESGQVNLTILSYACDIYVPNAFSPNDDGYNPVFRAVGNVNVTQMLIFNRWGEKLFESTESNPEWNGMYKGKLVQPGYYMFIIYYEKPEGEFVSLQAVSGELIVVY